MSQIIPYNRENALRYARHWAKDRNRNYFNYDSIGGDCTNFISQALFAGGCIMNYAKNFGWYYLDANNKSPSWTSAQFLYKFLIENKTIGPFAQEVNIDNIQIGDIVQLNFQDDYIFDHSLIITNIYFPRNFDNILISSHSRDRLDEPLSSIIFKKIRFLNISGSYQ